MGQLSGHSTITSKENANALGQALKTGGGRKIRAIQSMLLAALKHRSPTFSTTSLPTFLGVISLTPT
jgi:hypothetical protein